MATREEVTTKIKDVLAKEANIKTENILMDKELRKYPLTLDDRALGFIAIKLRRYIKKYNPNTTIKVGEVRKSELTVNDLISLVYNKIKAS